MNGNGSFAGAWRRVNGVALAPLVALPNLGMAAVNAAIGAAARLGERAMQAAGGALGTPGKLAQQVSAAVAARSLEAAKDSAAACLQSVRNAGGAMTGPGSNELLASTVLEKGLAMGALPMAMGLDTMGAMFEDVPALGEAVFDLWLRMGRLVDTGSSHGVLYGREPIKADTDALLRLGFLKLALMGPLQAVGRDFRGIVGGVLALGMGDFNWLARASHHYWASMEYVYDKWLAAETQPQSDFPIGELLAREGKEIIQRFPRPFVAALESGEPVRVVKALREDAGEIATMLSLYPFTAFQVTYDVLVFILKAWLQVEDTLDYALCELAVVDSHLGDEDKLLAMERLRKTAGNATVEFEYYVPLLVPFNGTPADRALRRSVTGQIIDQHTIARSVFRQEAIQLAQAINSELVQLRAFLWLFRDEAKARATSFRETARKFGPAVAERLERERREGTVPYPLTPAEVTNLIKPGPDESQDVPRTQLEVNLILYRLLRRRGLLYVSDLVFGDQPFITQRKEQFSAAYRPELPVPPAQGMI